MEPECAKELLGRERVRIEAELDKLKSAPNGELNHVDQNPADEGSETFEKERDSSIAEQLQAELEAIARAERRLEEGTYGFSIESGEPIPDERLEAQPWAERTVEEQARYESRMLSNI